MGSRITYILLIIISLGLYSCQDLLQKKIQEETNSLGTLLEYSDSSFVKESDFVNIDIKFPVISGKDNKYINTEIEKYIEKILTDYEGESLKEIEEIVKNSSSKIKYEEKLSYKIFKDSLFLSIVFNRYSYTHGAHGNTFYQTINVDLSHKKIVNLKETLELLGTDFVTLNDIIPDYYTNTDNCFSIDPYLSDSVANFAIDKNNLLIYYAPYELGAYVCGDYVLSLPLLNKNN